MTNAHELRSISDDELLLRLSQLLKQSRRVESELVAHIGETDARRLYARRACSSMFAYATDVLHLSEHEAYERITAARASRRFPMLLEMLRDGRLHLSGLGKLAPHLTEENCERLLGRAAYKTKRQIEELLAELSPKPDVPPVIRRIPERPTQVPQHVPVGELGPDRVVAAACDEPPPQPSPRPSAPPVVSPLAPSRYKISFTVSAEFRDKLERLQALERADLVAVIETAVTEKLARLEARRFAESKRPRTRLEETDTEAWSRYVPAAVRRFVCERDGNQCTFKDESGRRCTERLALEFHHRNPYGLGGDHGPQNVFLMCHAHNVYLAELDYGRETMDKYRRRDCVSEPSVAYLVETTRTSGLSQVAASRAL